MKPTIVRLNKTEKARKTLEDLETGGCFKFVDGDRLFQKTDEGKIVSLGSGLLHSAERCLRPIEEVKVTITYEVIEDAP